MNPMVLAFVLLCSAASNSETPIEANLVLPKARLRILAAELANDFTKEGGLGKTVPIVVGEFIEHGDGVIKQQLGKITTAELSHLLATVHGLFILERTRFDEVLAEIELQDKLGSNVDQALAEIAKQNGAEYLIVGEISQLGNMAQITGRIIAVAGAKVVSRAEIEIPLIDLVTFASNSVVLRSKAGAVYRSFLLPGWGQQYNRQPIKAIVFGSATATALVLAGTFHGLGQHHLNLYQRDTRASVRFGSRAEEDFKGRNISLWVALGIWAMNVADAYISGYSGGVSL